jgi:hypothetical protein
MSGMRLHVAKTRDGDPSRFITGKIIRLPPALLLILWVDVSIIGRIDHAGMEQRSVGRNFLAMRSYIGVSMKNVHETARI